MAEIKALIVEDEPKVADFLQRGLAEHEIETHIAYDGLMGKRLALQYPFDVIILDVNLPQKNGYQVCQELRAEGVTIPILMLTALGTTEDKLSGFDAGADDYLLKPFEFRELLARIRALLKRGSVHVQTGDILRVADLEINRSNMTVKRGGQNIDLTPKEFALLEYLARNKGRVVSRVDIAEKIWDLTFETGTNVIDVYVNFLRKKIDRNFTPKLIHTRKGMGYMLKEGED